MGPLPLKGSEELCRVPLSRLKYTSCNHCNTTYEVALTDKAAKGENTFVFPVKRSTVVPFGNLLGAVASSLELSKRGSVCLCDEGDCGRSGTAYGMALTYLIMLKNDFSEIGFSAALNGLYCKGIELFEGHSASCSPGASCPETLEQRMAILIALWIYKNFKKESFKYLSHVTFAYSGKAYSKTGFFAVRVGRREFLPVIKLGRPKYKNVEVETYMDVEELERVGGELPKVLLENYVPLKGRVVRNLDEVEELFPEGIELVKALGNLVEFLGKRR